MSIVSHPSPPSIASPISSTSDLLPPTLPIPQGVTGLAPAAQLDSSRSSSTSHHAPRQNRASKRASSMSQSRPRQTQPQPPSPGTATANVSLSQLEEGRAGETQPARPNTQSSDATSTANTHSPYQEKERGCGEGLPSSLPSSAPKRRRIFPPWKREDGWRGWANETVRTDALVLSLVVQAFSAGVLDATTYADFSTFASNQTGNTILLTVSVVGTVEVLVMLTGISLGSFLLASLVFGRLGHVFGLRRRAWVLTSTTYQVTILLLAAILVSPSGPSATHIKGPHEWVVLFLFAHMSGVQVASARQSACQELPTAPMTSTYVDLMSDKYLFVGFKHPKAGPRNRRLAYVLAMVFGGLLGACIHKYGGSWEVVVGTAGLKMVAFALVSCAAAE